MNKEMIKLSVIIPVYNTKDYLNKCIESVLSQSFSDFELICVDNHSTDGCSEILIKYAKKDPRIKYILTKKHGRATATRQVGLEAAKGEFITYVDSDDSIKPGMYQHMMTEQKKHDADIVVCNYDVVYPERIIPSYSNMCDEIIDIKTTGYAQYFAKHFCMKRPNNYLWSRVIRRSIVTQNDIEFQPVDISEDTIFTMFCTVFAHRVVHISKSYYNYFQREDSSMRVTIRSKNIANSYIHAFDCVEKYIKKHEIDEVFTDIMPLYAATRVRSIMFYMGLVGKEDETIYEKITSTLMGSSMLIYLRRALNENLIDNELVDTIHPIVAQLEKKV
jgi:glycosyltransferase involved in cell wall biosynthesis